MAEKSKKYPIPQLGLTVVLICVISCTKDKTAHWYEGRYDIRLREVYSSGGIINGVYVWNYNSSTYQGTAAISTMDNGQLLIQYSDSINHIISSDSMVFRTPPVDKDSAGVLSGYFSSGYTGNGITIDKDSLYIFSYWSPHNSSHSKEIRGARQR